MIAIGLILAIIVVIAGSKILFRSSGSLLAVEPSKCTDEYNKQKIEYFRDEIVKYGKRDKPGGGINEYYNPEEARKKFKAYVACKKEGLFTPENITAIEPAIMNNAKAVYGYYVEDISKQMAASTVKQERKDLYEKCAGVIEDYYDTFKVDFTQGRCPSP